jgi:hypothetical protein
MQWSPRRAPNNDSRDYSSVVSPTIRAVAILSGDMQSLNANAQYVHWSPLTPLATVCHFPENCPFLRHKIPKCHKCHKIHKSHKFRGKCYWTKWRGGRGVNDTLYLVAVHHEVFPPAHYMHQAFGGVCQLLLLFLMQSLRGGCNQDWLTSILPPTWHKTDYCTTFYYKIIFCMHYIALTLHAV